MNYVIFIAVLLALLGGLTGIYWVAEMDNHRITPRAERRERPCPPGDLRHQDQLARFELRQLQPVCAQAFCRIAR
jgi:hypothetical protein